MSLINNMLNELEKNRRSSPEHSSVLPGIKPTIKKQKGNSRWKIITLIVILIIVISFIWIDKKSFINNLSNTIKQIKNKLYQLPPQKIQQKQKPQVVASPLPLEPKIKLNSIVLAQQENQTLLDFILSSKTTYYIEYDGVNKQKLFITISDTGLSGNLPINLEGSFLAALNTKENKNSVTVTIDLLPGTKADEIHFVPQPKPHLHLAFSNPQLTNRSMSKTPTPISREQQEIERLKNIQLLLTQNKIHNAIHKLHLFIGDFPSNLQARTLLASLLVKNGKLRKAQEILHFGLRKYHNHVPFIKLKAHILIQQDKPKTAINLLEKHLHSANDIELPAMLAALHQQEGQFITAAEIYNQLTKIQPQEVKWWIGLGIALESANKINAAKEAFRHAINTHNISPELNTFLREKIVK